MEESITAEEKPEGSAPPEDQAQVTSLEESGSGEKAIDFRGGSDPVRSVAVRGLFILALFYTFYLARAFLLPIFLALIGTFVVSPLVRWAKLKLRVDEVVSSGAILLLIGGLLAYLVMMVSGPFVTWLNDAPAVIRTVQEKLREPIRSVTDATEKLNAATGAATAMEGEDNVVAVRSEKPGWGETLLKWAPLVAGNATVTVILLFFFLAYGDLFLLKVVKVLPTFSDKKNAVEIAHQIESQVSSYLATITVINVGLGVAIGVCMGLLGMPSPVLWGVMGALLNFIPYIGAVIGVVVVGIVAFAQFDSLSQGMLIPAVYFALTAIEGYFVTPILLGRRLILNPVIIFIGLVFWGWIWGVPGMLLAVPILAVFKIFCDHIKPLEPVGEFLGR